MAEKKGRLNSKDCIFALNLVRRARWFREQILGLDNCITVIRVMRDFCFRTPTWSKIDLWVSWKSYYFYLSYFKCPISISGIGYRDNSSSSRMQCWNAFNGRKIVSADF